MDASRRHRHAGGPWETTELKLCLIIFSRFGNVLGEGVVDGVHGELYHGICGELSS
jgi:hypothetical protein